MKYLIVCFSVAVLSGCTLWQRKTEEKESIRLTGTVMGAPVDVALNRKKGTEVELSSPAAGQAVQTGLGLGQALGLIGGPVGLAVAGGIAAWAQRTRANEHKKDADEAWVKVEEHALKRNPPA